MLALWTGILAGGLHALSGPDHLAALGPLALKRPAESTGVGASWGAGHGTGLLLLALIALGARVSLPLNTISWGAELAVGIWLMIAGVLAFRAHPVRKKSAAGPAGGQRTAFFVGLLHGATGAGHVVAVLPGLGLSESGAIAYLCGFALAAAASMGIVGKLLGGFALRSGPTSLAQLRRACAALAVAVGVFWTGQALAFLP